MAKQIDLNKWVANVVGGIVEDELKDYVKKENGKVLSTNDYTTTEKNKLSGIEAQANKTNVDSSLSTTSENPVQNKVINTALINKVDKETGKGLFTGSYNDLTNKPTIPTNTSQLINDSGFITPNDINGGPITVEQQASPDTGYTATYVIKQDGTQVGTKINIPKDFLVRRATVETSIANNSPQAGFIKGDKYLDFVVNTKDNSGVDEHLYINVNDLFNEYEADETTLTLSADNVFSIKNGAIPQANTTATNIKMNGTQSAGSASTWAKADHVHPVDTSRAASSHTHSKSEITDFPTSMTPTSHAHGSITNNGTLNSDTNNANKIVVTDSSQNIKTISKIPYAKIDNTPTIPSKTSDLTNDSGFITSNDVHVDLTDYVKTNDTRLSDARQPTFHTHVKSDISDFPTLATVATSGSYNDLSNLPPIPSASSVTPSADTTNGAIGSSSNYAKADHQHPLSTAYATSGHTHTGMLTSSDVGTSSDTSSSKIVACNDTRLSDARTPTSHTHTYGNITDVSTVQVLVTYTDDTTETLDLVIWEGATIVTNVVLTYGGGNYATATVTNGKGDGIKNKTVTLYTNLDHPQYSPNGVLGTATTNNNGVAQIYNSHSGGWIYGTIYCVCDDVTSNSIDSNNTLPGMVLDDDE